MIASLLTSRRRFLSGACALLAALLAAPVTLHAQAELSTYDLRDVGGISYVPDLQDQLAIGDCWTFSAATAMSSNLLYTGNVSTASYDGSLLVSVWHLASRNGSAEALSYNPAANSGQGGYENTDGSNSWGGFQWMAMGYLTRGRAPSDEAWATPDSSADQVPYFGGGVVSPDGANAYPTNAINLHEDLGDSLPKVSQPLTYTTRSVYMFDAAASGLSGTAQIDAVKEGIATHGALTTYMSVGGGTFSQGSGNNYYEYTNTSQPYDHAVTIIGWDDSVTMPDNSTGAWIIQNSWGVDPGYDYFYAGYNDPIIGQTGVAAYSLEPAGAYKEHVLQNELGPFEVTAGDAQTYGNATLGMMTLDASDGLASSMSALSIFEIGQNDTLAALGLVSAGANSNVLISVYIDEDGGDPLEYLDTNPEADLMQTVAFLMTGYELFDLSEFLFLEIGETLIVRIDYGAEASEVPYVLFTDEQDASSLTGRSYMLGTDDEWGDLAEVGSLPGAFFLKGYMAIPEPSAAVLFLSSGIVLFLRRRRA